MPRPETIPLQHGQLPNTPRLSACRSRVLALLCGSPSTWLQPVSRPVVRSNPRRRVTAGGAKYRILLERYLQFLGSAAARAVSTDRSGGHEASPAAAHVLRIDQWITNRPHPRGFGDAGKQPSAGSPLMTQLGKPLDGGNGVSPPGGVLQKQKKFDPQRIPNLQPLVGKHGATVQPDRRRAYFAAVTLRPKRCESRRSTCSLIPRSVSNTPVPASARAS